MTLRYSIDVRNAGLDARVECIGQSPLLRVFAEPPPGSCSASDPGGLLCEMKLPKVWIAKAVDGAANKQGIWTGISAVDGAAKCFRIYSSRDSVCRIQGSIPMEMRLDSAMLHKGQNFSVASFVINSGNG